MCVGQYTELKVLSAAPTTVRGWKSCSVDIMCTKNQEESTKKKRKKKVKKVFVVIVLVNV